MGPIIRSIEFEYYDKGRTARMEGIAREDCPFVAPIIAHYRKEWELGWDCAIEDAEMDGIEIPETAIR